MNAGRFAARLKELRGAAGWTQQQLADCAGLSKGGIADLEQGRYAPTWPTVVALAEALGVDCRAFLEEPAAAVEPRRGRPRKPISGLGTAEPPRESSQGQP